MTDRRPPHDAPAQDEPESASDGKAQGNRSGARPAPRSTFSDPDAGKKPARVESGPAQAAPRSVFQPASSPRPAADPDVTVKRAYPGAWGSTIVVNGAPPPAPAPTDTDKTVRVDRNKLPATMMLDSEEPPAAQATKPRSVAPPPPPPASGRPPQHAAEPLRVPSNHPASAPQPPKRAASGTLLMPGADDESVTNVRQAPTPAPAAEAHATRPRAPTPTHSAEAQPRQRKATPAQPQASTPMTERSNPRTPPTARTPEPQATARRPASPAKTESLHPVKKNSEPIRLALDARDERLEAQSSVGTKVPRNRAPMMIAGAAVLVLVVVAIVAAIKHSSSSTAVTEPSVDGTRASAVPADQVPAAVQQPQPTTPVAPAATPQPTTPAAAVKQPVPVAQKTPVAPVQKTEPARAERATPASKTPAPAAKPKHEAKPPAEESGEVLDAREALKGLNGEPVVKVRKKSEEDDLADRAMQNAINRPPAPPSDEPVMKVKPEPSNEPPPPAP